MNMKFQISILNIGKLLKNIDYKKRQYRNRIKFKYFFKNETEKFIKAKRIKSLQKNEIKVTEDEIQKLNLNFNLIL